MIKILKISLVIAASILLFNSSLLAQTNQDEKTTCLNTKLNIGADIMSRYIWRGTDYGSSPSIQPTLSLSLNDFEIGGWGSIATNSFYKEIDLYAKYTFKNVSLIFTDYYIPSAVGTPASPDTRYFTYADKMTSHTLEGSVLVKGGEKFPFWVMAGVFFYGNDKRWGYNADKDAAEQTYYSTYIEAGYTFAIKQNNADVFLGFTPSAGAYGNTLGVVNLGVTGYRKIKITDNFELPVKASLIFNPQSSNVFFAFGITL